MAKNWKDYLDMGPAIYALNSTGKTDELFEAAKALRGEVARRLKQAEKYAPLKRTKAYKQLTNYGRSTGVLVLTRQQRGETIQQYRGRIQKEINRAMTFLQRQTSSKEGYQAWRKHIIEKIANAAGVDTKEVERTFAFGRFEEFFSIFEEVMQANQLFYQLDSEQTFKVSYEIIFDESNKGKSTAEIVDDISKKLDELNKQGQLGRRFNPYAQNNTNFGGGTPQRV